MQRSSLVVSTPLIVVASLSATACREDAPASPPALATASPVALATASPPAFATASPPASPPASALASQPAAALQSAPVTPPTAPPTRSLPSSPALSREAVKFALNVLLESGRIDAATQTRALDVLVPAATLSATDARLASIFQALLLADGAERQIRVERLDSDVARAVDPPASTWRVFVPELQGNMDDLEPALKAELTALIGQGYPLFVRDLETGIDFRLVPGGAVPGRAEGQRTRVEPFYIAICEVDECDWFRFRGGDRASLLPAEGRSWNAVSRYCSDARLSLPTEVEWEFAARAGTRAAFWMGEFPILGEIHCARDAARDANQRGVNMLYPANRFGLYHVHGNVAEWCTHPLGALGGEMQAVRGGSYCRPIEECAVASRELLSSDQEHRAVGFRPIRRITPGVTELIPSEQQPLRVVVVDDGGALDDHWRVKVVTETPDAEIHRLDPAFVDRVLATQKTTGLPWEVEDLETGLRMRLVPAGEFIVTEKSGSDAGYRVLIKHPFYLSECEVTLGDWQRRLGGELLNSTQSLRPISSKSWTDCRNYMRRAYASLRFPNEFEWQWACTFGKDMPFGWPKDEALSEREKVNHKGQWIAEPFLERLVDVGRMTCNPYGFRGMHGNVFEWCLNPFDLDELIPEPDDRPIGLTGDTRVIRGGDASATEEMCWAGTRVKASRGANAAGFRVARSVVSSRDLLVREWPKDARRSEDDIERPRPGEGKSTETGGDPSKPGGAVETPTGVDEGKEKPGGGEGGGGTGAVEARPRGVGTLQGKNNGQNQGGSSGSDNGSGNGRDGEGDGRDGREGKDEKDRTLPSPDAPIETNGT